MDGVYSFNEATKAKQLLKKTAKTVGDNQVRDLRHWADFAILHNAVQINTASYQQQVLHDLLYSWTILHFFPLCETCFPVFGEVHWAPELAGSHPNGLLGVV